jgi:hypothetical protein
MVILWNDGPDEFIRVRDACKMSGLTLIEIRRAARGGLVKFEYIKGKLYVSIQSTRALAWSIALADSSDEHKDRQLDELAHRRKWRPSTN